MHKYPVHHLPSLILRTLPQKASFRYWRNRLHVHTAGTTFTRELRDAENGLIACARSRGAAPRMLPPRAAALVIGCAATLPRWQQRQKQDSAPRQAAAGQKRWRLHDGDDSRRGRGCRQLQSAVGAAARLQPRGQRTGRRAARRGAAKVHDAPLHVWERGHARFSAQLAPLCA